MNRDKRCIKVFKNNSFLPEKHLPVLIFVQSRVALFLVYSLRCLLPFLIHSKKENALNRLNARKNKEGVKRSKFSSDLFGCENICSSVVFMSFLWVV